MSSISERIAALREEMQREGLGAYIFTSTDPHQSEYVADHWKGREWISGFDGSAGTAVVTMDAAALWTDSRYFLQAEEQLRGTEFQLMKLKIPGTPTIAEWLNHQLSIINYPLTEVAIDGSCASASQVRQLVKELREHGGLTLRTNFDPLTRIWTDRPPIPVNPVEIFPMEYAGESAHDKIARIRKALREQHADGMLMAALDDIAWTLNLRGTDVHCTPVFVSYLLIQSPSGDNSGVTLYINKVKLTPEVEAYLKAEGVGVAPYEDVARGLRDYFEYNILMDPDEVNDALFHIFKERGRRNEERGTGTEERTCHVVENESPVKRMKTVKNATEIAGFRSAMLKDGIAMVRFLRWLSEAVARSAMPLGSSKNSTLSEMSISEKLASYRAEQPLYRDISFDTIAGYGTHAAIVHYEPTADTDIPLEPRGLLLLDSGAQYLDGTTDITRTIALGPLTDEEKLVYTLVLKGHIQLEMCKFPSGSSGTQLDILARKDMWRYGLNYLHGTGHGVGTYLCVHEGPHQFRMEWKPAPLVAGMTITDEPGIYLPGRCGARTENTLLIVPYKTTEFGEFLQFEPLTLCPIDTTPIIVEMMTDEEQQWLNDYHQTVYDRLAPHLDADDRQWLAQRCAPITH